MRTKQEEKLYQQLLLCKRVLHLERQRDRDMRKSREQYKIKNRSLTQTLKEVQAVKKNGRLDCLPNSLSPGTNIPIL
jgi:hypothetical protein